MRKAIVATAVTGAVVGALVFAAPVKADITLTGGLQGVTNETPLGNNLVVDLYGVAPGEDVSGYYFGNVRGIGFIPGFLTVYKHDPIFIGYPLVFEYLGKEAGFNNQFIWGPNLTNVVFTTNGSSVGDRVNLGVYSGEVLPFIFGANGNVNLAPNKSSPATGDFCENCSIFVVFLDDDPTSATYLKPTTGTSSQIVDVFFNDGSTDDNHDDMAVRISPVPVPAALPIIGAALAGFGFAGYRSRRNG